MSDNIWHRDLFIEDFTLDNYRKLLKISKDLYDIANYYDYESKKKCIIWRHDIDASIDYALKLAEIEHEEGVRAIYFVLTHSDFYNPLEKMQLNKLFQIQSLGHEIGIHLDVEYYNISSEKDIQIALEKEKYLFEEIMGFKPGCFSFHNPTESTLQFNRDAYSGLINVYNKNIRSNMTYCSDSNGFWRYNRLEEVISDSATDKLHVLTHPAWWQENAKIPSDRIKWIIESRGKAIWQAYSDTLVRYGRPNI